MHDINTLETNKKTCREKREPRSGSPGAKCQGTAAAGPTLPSMVCLATSSDVCPSLFLALVSWLWASLGYALWWP